MARANGRLLLVLVTACATASSHVITQLDDSSFDAAVESHDFSFVLFTASWCSHSQKATSTLEHIGNDVNTDLDRGHGRVKRNDHDLAPSHQVLFATVDVDTSPSVASSYGITHVPELIAFSSYSAASFNALHSDPAHMQSVSEFVRKRTHGAVSLIGDNATPSKISAQPDRPLALAVLTSDTQRAAFHAAALRLDGVDFGERTFSYGNDDHEDDRIVGITVLPPGETLRSDVPMLTDRASLEEVDDILRFIERNARAPMVMTLRDAIDAGKHEGSDRLLVLLLPPNEADEDGYSLYQDYELAYERDEHALDVFERACARSPVSFACAMSDTRDSLSAFGVTDDDMPRVAAVEQGGALKYTLAPQSDGGDIDEDAIVDFANRIQTGEEPPIIISEEEPSSNSLPGSTTPLITAKKLDELLQSGSEVLLAVIDDDEDDDGGDDANDASSCQSSSCLLGLTVDRVKRSLPSNVWSIAMLGSRNEHPNAPSKRLPAVHFFASSGRRYELNDDGIRAVQSLFNLVISNCEACNVSLSHVPELSYVFSDSAESESFTFRADNVVAGEEMQRDDEL